MKQSALLLLLFCVFASYAQTGSKTQHVFIITVDGLRWQEVFTGADKQIIGNREYVKDPALLREMYWDDNADERRRKLLPFFWNIIARKGQLYGNRLIGNRMNVSNIYKFSYPGYCEMFTGFADRRFVPNTPVSNRNTNIFEYLNKQPGYKGRVAAFTSWNIFPYILNEKRSGFPVNSGYEALDGADTNQVFAAINRLQDSISDKCATRYDEITYLGAKEYIRQKHPKVLLIALGESDEFAHHGQYDKYLQSIANTDRMIAELWYMVQTDPVYKDNTTFIITTDHGRGRKPSTWTDHLFLVGGSREVWLAMLGPGIQPLGEVRKEQVLYQRQIAATIANLLQEHFVCEHSVSGAIELPEAPASIIASGQ